MSGVTRQSYSTEIRIIRVMCTGRVDLAFEGGVEDPGVGLGDAHFAGDGDTFEIVADGRHPAKRS